MTRAKDISKIVTDANLSGTLDVAGAVTAGGNVGINESNPSSSLHIYGSTPKITLEHSNENGTAQIYTQAQSGIILDADPDNTDNGTPIQLKTDGKARLLVEDSGDISFYEDTGTTPKFFWDASAESLGIGTTSVGSPLVVSTSFNTGYLAQFVNTGTGSDANGMLIKGGVDASDYTLRLQNQGGTEILSAKSNGNVAIGHTSTGGSNFAICDGANSQIQFFTEISTDTNLIQHYDPTASAYMNSEHRANSHEFKIGTSNAVKIDSSGRLLLGTTTEGEAGADDLTIATTGHTGMTIRSGTSSEGSLFFSDGTAGDDEYRGFVQYLHSSNSLRFGSNAVERMRIDSAGHVTMPYQPAFQARPSSTLTNIAINTNVNLNFANEIFDKNADYNAGGSPSTFTAPVTGVYQLNLNAYILNLDTASTFLQISIITSNRSYDLVINPRFTSDPSFYHMTISALADMDAGDTAYLQAYQSGGTAQTDISAGATFSGYLVA